MNQRELDLILEEGEGYRIEFKESLSGIDKEMVAFANASGGRLFLGITDDGVVKGVRVTNTLRSQVQDVARNCQPAVPIRIEELGNVLIVHVQEGPDKPYKASGGFYTRIGANSQKLSRNEIMDFFKSEGKIRFDELINLKFDFETHFSPEKLARFLQLAGISQVHDPATILVNLGVAERQEGKLIFNNTGILFFARNLQDIYFHTAITCALYKGTEKVHVLDRRDFNEDIISAIDSAMIFLKQHIPVRYEMTGSPQRREVPEIPYEALREAVINAVAHRDYFERGSNIMVEMFDDRIQISSFGGLPKGLKLEELGQRSVLRNPNIANLLHRIQYIERMGTGIPKMRRLMEEAGLAPVEFDSGTFFTATFRRPVRRHETTVRAGTARHLVKEVFDETANETANETVKQRIAQVLIYIHQSGSATVKELMQAFEVSRATVHRDLAYLKDKGLIVFEGAPKTGRYVLTPDGARIIEETARD